jgi:hypothetical protein
MTMTPTRQGMTPEDLDSVELLIKEAQQIGRRRRLRKAAAVFAILLVVAAIVSTTIYLSQPNRLPNSGKKGVIAANYPRCTVSQLSVTSENGVGAGGTDGGILLFRNISTHACSLSGYPIVVAIGRTKGQTITASDALNDMLGGWDWSGVASARKLPTVDLANKNDVASDWYQYGENGPAGYTLFHASTLSIGLQGSKSAFQVRSLVDAAEGKMVVTPFVPGKTGSGEPRTSTSSQG